MLTKRSQAVYDDWADYYDLVEGDRTPTISFYRSLISGKTSSLLELGCGTGAITIPLAEALFGRARPCRSNLIVGIDASYAMLRVARSRDDRIRWIQSDIRSLPLQASFNLVMCCFNTIQFILTDEELQRFFVAIRGLLSSRGIFAFDIYQPNFDVLINKPKRNNIARIVTDRHGKRFEQREDYLYDPASRLLTIQYRLVDADAGPARAISRLGYPLKQYLAAEILDHLAASGLEVLQRYGDLDRAPFTTNSPKQVLICKAQ